jgi:hypothetical protein
MADSSKRNRVYAIDPIFYVPEEMDDYVYDEVFDDEIEPPQGGFLDSGVVIYPPEPGESEPATLATPENLQIVQQIIRTSADGTQVVDVVFSVEDVPGAVTYEFRLDQE